MGASESTGDLGLGPFDRFGSIDSRDSIHRIGGRDDRCRDEVQLAILSEMDRQARRPNRDLFEFLGIAEVAVSQRVGFRGNQGQLGIGVLQLE